MKFSCLFLTAALDNLSACLVGSGTLVLQHLHTISIAVVRLTLCPILMKIGFIIFSALRKAAPHDCPDSPINSTHYPAAFVCINYSLTDYLFKPSTANIVLLTPTQGISRSTPK